jgi:hypothetical protein
MDEELQKKMQTLMYHLTKNAARYNYAEFLDDCEISVEDYIRIKAIWREQLGITPYV